MINDVSGGNFDRKILSYVADSYCPFICMHMRGNPKTMSKNNIYNNISEDVINELKISLEKCENSGILK